MKKIVILLTLCFCLISLQAQKNCQTIISQADNIKVIAKDYYAVQQNGKWGVRHNDKEVLSCQYDSIDVFSDGVITFVQNSKIGFADSLGRIISPAIYLQQSPYEIADQSLLNTFENGSALVYYNDRLMLLGKDGATIGSQKEIISKSANTVVFKQDAAYGMMDAQGNVTADNKYRRIQTIIAGKIYAYTAQQNGMDMLGLIDSYGQIKSKAQYQDMIIINKADKYYIKAFAQSGKQALYDQEGNLLFQPLYQNIEPTQYDSYFLITDNGKKGVIGRDYNIYVPTEYDNITICHLNEDTFFVANKQLTTYILDKSNNTLDIFDGVVKDFVSFDKQEITYIADSMLNFGIRSNKQGWIVKPQYLDIFALAGDKLIVRKKDKWGIVDMSSNQIAGFDFNKVRASKAKTCIVLYEGKKESLLVNQDGQVIAFEKVDKVLPMASYIEYTVKKEKVRLYFDGTKIKGKYKQLGSLSEGILLVQDNKGWAYVDPKTMEYLSNERYTYATQFKDAKAMVVKDNKLFVIDNKFSYIKELMENNNLNMSVVANAMVIAQALKHDYIIVKDKQNKYTLININY